MVPFLGEFLRTFIGGVLAGMSRGSGVGSTLVSGAGVIVSSSVGGDVGTTLTSKSGMVGGRRDLESVVAR